MYWCVSCFSLGNQWGEKLCTGHYEIFARSITGREEMGPRAHTLQQK